MDDAPKLSTLGEFEKLYNALLRRHRVSRVRRCYLCDERCPTTGLCDGCYGDLPHRSAVRVARKLPFIEAVFVACDFTYPLDHVIRRAKFFSDLAALNVCGMMLTQAVSTYLKNIDVVIPVPLSRRRYLGRAYNQAVEIARPLASALNRPLASQTVRRIIHRPAQSTLSAHGRKANIDGSFACSNALAGRRVLIVDDVITTGTTITELARTLAAGGAASVTVAALASTK